MVRILVSVIPPLFILESQVQYIVKQLIRCYHNKRSIEVTTDWFEYNQMLDKAMHKTVWSWGGCKSWYQNAHGKVVALLPIHLHLRALVKAFKSEHHHYH